MVSKNQSQTQPIKQITVLKSLIPYLWVDDWRLRIRIFISLFFVFATIVLNMLIPIALKAVIKLLSSPSQALYAHAMLILITYGALWTLAQLTLQMREIVMFRTMERSIRLLSLAIFKHLHTLSMRFHMERRTGAITNAIERAQHSLPDIFWGVCLFVVPTAIEIMVSTFILIYMYGIYYGAAMLSIFVVYILFSMKAMEWSVDAQRMSNIQEVRTQSRVVDSLLNFETVKYFNNQKYEYEQTDELLKKREDAATRKHISIEIVHLGQGLIIGCGLTVMTVLAGRAVLSGTMDVSDFSLMNGYVLQFVVPLSYFGYFFRKMRKGLTDMEDIMRILSLKPEIVNVPDAKPLHVTNAQIVFDDVVFGYDSRRPILKGVSFTVPAGKTVAIVGSTGAGKSTIARLLFRFYDVISGRILIDGQDISKVTQDSLRDAIGIVPQDTMLFNNTLYYNIAYGYPDATKEEVLQAVHLAHLDSFVATLPDGIHTEVGERGLKLSGGEKQRIAIARVILKRPYIYIFDEATSALDTKTEREIQKNLEEISEGSTTVIIAHRLSTVVHADEIIVLGHGQVVERGTHQQLLSHKGAYARLWAKQAHEDITP